MNRMSFGSVLSLGFIILTGCNSDNLKTSAESQVVQEIKSNNVIDNEETIVVSREGTILENETVELVNCTESASAVEQTICGNSNLKILDARMLQLYNSAGGSPNIQVKRYQEQIEWKAMRDALCDSSILSTIKVTGCLEKLYMGRTKELELSQTQTVEASAGNDRSWVNDIGNLCWSYKHQLPEDQKAKCINWMYLARISELETRIKDRPTSLKKVGVNSSKETPSKIIPEVKTVDTTYSLDKETMEQEFGVKLFQEGYMFLPPSNKGYEETKQIMERALSCATDLNVSRKTKRRICYNHSTEFGKTDIRLRKSNPVCASVNVMDQPFNLLLTKDGGNTGIDYSNGTLKIMGLMGGENGLLYDFEEEEAAALVGGVMRMGMSECVIP